MTVRPQSYDDSAPHSSFPAQSAAHPLPTGYIFESPGAHLTYRVIGPCCRLYDREQLPWPCCRIQWHSKEPSWRRIGRRLIADLATRKHPSYSVEIVGQSYRSEPIVMTMYTVKLGADLQNWWHTKRLSSLDANGGPEKQLSAKRVLNPNPDSGNGPSVKTAPRADAPALPSMRSI